MADFLLVCYTTVRSKSLLIKTIKLASIELNYVICQQKINLMKAYFFRIILFLGFLSFTFSAQAQMEHCCKDNKKVKIRKQKKRSRGALVGVKGHDDKKALKNKMKAMKSERKAKRAEFKAAAKEEKELEELEKFNENTSEDPFDSLGLDKPDDLKEEPTNNKSVEPTSNSDQEQPPVEDIKVE